MTDKLYCKLSAPRKTMARIGSLQSQIKVLEMATLPGAIRYDKDKVQSTPVNKQEEIIADIDERWRKLVEQQKKLVEETTELTDMFSQLDLEKSRIMQCYYIAGMSWSKVAEEVNYSERHLYRLKGEAIADLEKIV